jgi:2-polyprenyl-3-methyl-5-hydroxy-6-metoxy-1,4-benzoquinol methylase
VQGLSVAALNLAWKMALFGGVRDLFKQESELSLYESDTGLMFFDPRIEGDETFYRQFYNIHKVQKQLDSFPLERSEYLQAASWVKANDRVLDVGCGQAQFAKHITQAHYTGLDLYAVDEKQKNGSTPHVLKESAMQHACSHPTPSYDVVTAFQVLEHVANPLAFTQTLCSLLRPGGILILSAPLHPSPQTALPNYLLNFPPHHLTWWNTSAFHALATTLGLQAVQIAALPYSPHESITHWMHRFSFLRTRLKGHERYYSHRWSWYVNLLTSYLLALPLSRLIARPTNPLPTNVMLVAIKPDTANLVEPSAFTKHSSEIPNV